MFHFIIDGYNLLYALPDIPAGTLEQKRAALLALLQERQPHGRNRLTVVFDSREGGGRSGQGAIEIIYAGPSADDWISEFVRKQAQPQTLVIVTNDRGIHRLVGGTGARVMGAGEFLKSKMKASPRPADAPDPSITEEFKKKWLEP